MARHGHRADRQAYHRHYWGHQGNSIFVVSPVCGPSKREWGLLPEHHDHQMKHDCSHLQGLSSAVIGSEFLKIDGCLRTIIFTIIRHVRILLYMCLWVTETVWCAVVVTGEPAVWGVRQASDGSWRPTAETQHHWVWYCYRWCSCWGNQCTGTDVCWHWLPRRRRFVAHSWFTVILQLGFSDFHSKLIGQMLYCCTRTLCLWFLLSISIISLLIVGQMSV